MTADGPYELGARIARGAGWSVWDGTHRSSGQPVVIRVLHGAADSFQRLRDAALQWPAEHALASAEILIRRSSDILTVYPVGPGGRLDQGGPLDRDELAALHQAVDRVLQVSEAEGWQVGGWFPALVSRRGPGWQVAGLVEARGGLLGPGDAQRDVDGACALLRRVAADPSAAAALCVRLRADRATLASTTPPVESPAPVAAPARSTAGLRRTASPAVRTTVQLVGVVLVLVAVAIVATLRGPTTLDTEISTAQAQSTAPPSAGSAQSAQPAVPDDWLPVIRELYALRAQAVRDLDPGLLADVYTQQSEQRARDEALITALVATGREALTFTPEVVSVTQAHAGTGVTELVIRDRVAAFTVTDRSGGASEVAARPEATVEVTLRLVDGRWLIESAVLVG